MTTHYNKAYFAWQEKAGIYGATQDKWMYKNFIKESDSVLDFGCGGGFLLDMIACKKKYGIDINSIARKKAQKKGIEAYESIAKLPVNLKFDIIISHHTLEHIGDPAAVLSQLKEKLKKKGKIIVVVPIDDWRKQKKYNPLDINKHLYTWTPLLLGNLFDQCGFKIESIRIISTAWLPLSRFYYFYVPSFIYYFFSRIWSMIILSRQIRIVATV